MSRVLFVFRPYIQVEALDELRQLEAYFQDKAQPAADGSDA